MRSACLLACEFVLLYFAFTRLFVYNGLSSVAMTVFDKSLSLCPQLLAIPKS